MAFTSAGEAGIINVASLDRAAILNAVATARDGDIVRLPAGTAEWTTTVRIDKAIILQGAGIGSTIITDGVFSGHLLEWLLVANKTSRMTGIEFRPGANISTAGNRNTYNRILVSGTNIDSRSMRIDNCRIASLAGPAFLFSTANGVVDNCTIIGAAEGVPAFVGHVKGSSWGGQQSVNTFGDGAYVDSDKFGTDQFTVFEDNTISNLFSSLTALDCQAGGRYVFRRNTMTKGSLETHGAEASRERSGRAFEIYDNTFIGDGVRSSPIYMRGGVGLVYNNTFTNWTASASISLLDNRSSDHLFSPISGADGRNPWDKNTPAKATGTVTSAGTLSVSDSSKTWTANQWAGHTIRRTSGKTVTSLTRSGTTCTAVAAAHGFATDTYISIWGADHYAYNGFYRITRVDDNTFTFQTNFDPPSPATGAIRVAAGSNFSEISSNTATTLNFSASIYGAPAYLSFAPGDTFEINKVDQSWDQVGVAGGANLQGKFMPDLPTSNTQSVSPWYEWNNTRDGGINVNFSISRGGGGTFAVIVPGVHFKNDTPLTYTPLAYPHPLRKPAAPSDLRLSQP